MEVSESTLRSIRAYLAQPIGSRTDHLPKDDPFCKGMAVGMEIIRDNALALFDSLIPLP